MILVKLSNRTKSRISLMVLFITFEIGIFVIKTISPNLRLDPFTWLMLVFAAGLGGSGIAYLFIGDWLRWPLTKEVKHSSNSKMIEIEPKYEGWLNGPGVLICCPICAGTWVGAALLVLMAVNYSLGYYTILTLSIGGAARVIIRFSELLEWQSRYAQEKTAELNRRNAEEEEQKEYHVYNQVTDNEVVTKHGIWVVKEDEVQK